MRGFTAAWLLGLAVVTWKQVHASHHLPVPGALAGVTGLFAALGLVADISPSAAPVVTWAAWGLDLAGVLNILPAGLSGQISQSQTAETAAEGGAPAGTGKTAGTPGKATAL
jgi:uncharacterized YccA/Bax inhibitor family protein